MCPSLHRTFVLAAVPRRVAMRTDVRFGDYPPALNSGPLRPVMTPGQASSLRGWAPLDRRAEAGRPREVALEAFLEGFAARAPWVLLVGAGVSVAAPARVPLAAPIIEALLSVVTQPSDGDAGSIDALRQSLVDLRRRRPGSLTRYMPFEAILGEVAAHSAFVPSLLKAMFPAEGTARPNRDHRAVAELVRAGYVDLVLTTNLDECLEGVLDRHSCSVHYELGEVTPKRPALVKLHGTVSRPDSLAATPAGLAERVNDASWQASLLSAIAGRDVLVVGYSFSDFLDLSRLFELAATVKGTRFHWARHGGDWQRVRVPLFSVFEHDLAAPTGGVLVRLAEQFGLVRADTADWASLDEQVAQARAVVAAVLRPTGLIDLATRFKTLGALFYWLEDGRRALDMFVRARAVDPASVDHHLLARALLRARRYGAAVRTFDELLRDQLPSEPTSRLEREVDWCCGAAHGAAAGGRPLLAADYYRRASRALARDGLVAEELKPYLADQYLRGRAANEIRLALVARDPQVRREQLALAEDLLKRMSVVRNVELKTRPHLFLDQARLAIARGERPMAQARLVMAREHMAYWGDGHDLVVCDRLLAAADHPDARLLLLRQINRAVREGHWLELTKLTADLLGWHGFAWWQARLRHRFVRFWDQAKDVLVPLSVP